MNTPRYIHDENKTRRPAKVSPRGFRSFRGRRSRSCKRPGRAVCLALALGAQAGPLAAADSVPPRPNIVLIVVDDMGWSDIGSYGSEIRTPNLDALADEGLRFREFYNTAKCFPSRAALLTGVYAQQNGMDVSADNVLRNAATIGEVLGAAGYHTYMSGKHHGLDNPFNRGFDRYYGLRDGAANHFNPGLRREGEPEPGSKGRTRYWADDGLVFDTRDPDFQHYFPKNFYSTDAYTGKALEYLDDWAAADTRRPFLLYLSYTAPHDPLQARPEDIAAYEGVYDAGYESIRQARYQRQVDMGLLDPGTNTLPAPSHRDWDALPAAEKADQARRMEVYAAMIDRVDQKVGELVAYLQAIGAYENTLILFCSDNGASAQSFGIDDPPTDEIGSLGNYVSLQADWANVANAPFRFFKNDSYNGGIRTPLIAHWPAGIVDPGRVTDRRGHFVDFMATFIELAGADYPRFQDGGAVVPLQGESFADAFSSGATGCARPCISSGATEGRSSTRGTSW